MKEKALLPMNLQFFAEDHPGGTDPATTPQPPASGGNPAAGAAGQTAPAFDYEKLASIIQGKQTVAEDTVLKNYFQQQGLSKEEMAQAITAFKQQKAAQQPDVAAMQTQLQQAQNAARQANVEKEAMFMASEVGVNLQTMPYVLQLADMSNVTDDKEVVNKETLKKALNAVLEKLPQLKATDQSQQSGFRQIGAGGNQNTTGNEDDQLAAIFGNTKK